MAPPENKGMSSPSATRQRLEVTVLNADLRFTGQALLVGHYRSTTLTGAEAAIDVLLDQRMSRALNAGLYPSAPGSHQVFRNSCVAGNEEATCLPAVVVAGLGDEGELRAADLVYTVRQAILAFAQRLSEQHGDAAPTGFSMAATLIGSGGSSRSKAGRSCAS